jgi:hypothetical protein
MNPSLNSVRHPFNHVTGQALSVLTLVLAAGVWAGPLQGQTLNWNNATSSNALFENPSNWTPNAIPGSGSALEFELPSAYQVWWGPNTEALSPTVHALWIDGGNVTFVNVNPAQQSQLEVLGGIGPTGHFRPLEIHDAALTLSGLHLLNQGRVLIGFGGVLNIDGAHSAGSRLTVGGTDGLELDGT